MYAGVSRQVRAPKQDRAVRQAMKQWHGRPCYECGGLGQNSPGCGDITADEVVAQLRLCRNGKAPGADQICAEHLKHLGPRGMALLVRLISTSWHSKTIPNELASGCCCFQPQSWQGPR
jgi:hypothetical protein